MKNILLERCEYIHIQYMALGCSLLSVVRRGSCYPRIGNRELLSQGRPSGITSPRGAVSLPPAARYCGFTRSFVQSAQTLRCVASIATAVTQLHGDYKLPLAPSPETFLYLLKLSMNMYSKGKRPPCKCCCCM
jgi:hypothetical protein